MELDLNEIRTLRVSSTIDPDESYRFTGEARNPLSNSFPVTIQHEGLIFNSVEAAYQAAKTTDKTKRFDFQEASPTRAMNLGKLLELRPDWEDVKKDIMKELLFLKFEQPELKAFLKTLGTQYLIHDTSSWHDQFWGSCRCDKCRDLPAHNNLGRLLNEVKHAFR